MKTLRSLPPLLRPYLLPSIVSLALLSGLVIMDLSIPGLIRRIIDQGILGGSLSTVLSASAVMLLISAMSVLFAVGNNIFSVRVGESVARDLRERLFVRIQGFSEADLDGFSTGNLMVRLSSDTSAVQRLIQITLRIGTRAPLMMIGSVVLMFRTDAPLALTILPLLVLTGAVIVWFSFRMEPLFGLVQAGLDRLNTVLQENISGIRVVKSFVRSRYERGRFEGANEDYTLRTERVMKFMAVMTPVLTLMINLGIVAAIWAGGVRTIRGALTLGQVVAFVNYLLSTMNPLTMMGNLANTWSNGLASMSRILEVLEAEPSVKDAPDAIELPPGSPGRVAFERVGFRYRGSGAAPVLEDITFTAEPGRTTAILGATGSGKSTLVKLIPRLYDATSGRVTVDGIDVKRLKLESLLSAISTVHQETVLFSGTVRDNIRYGRPDAPDDEVFLAARAASAHDFILELPQGYDTRVEERGVNLSGGQKQRIAIARALTVRPRILILDDATSSVDARTETEIRDALKTLLAGTTVIIVAQRISSVLHADGILVLDRGRLVASGNHGELMESSSVYREIYDSQLGDGYE